MPVDHGCPPRRSSGIRQAKVCGVVMQRFVTRFDLGARPFPRGVAGWRCAWGEANGDPRGFHDDHPGSDYPEVAAPPLYRYRTPRAGWAATLPADEWRHIHAAPDARMTVIVTGAAGFIGYHVAEALLARGERVVGVDNLNAYYDVRLKQARLERLRRHARFRRSTARRGGSRTRCRRCSRRNEDDADDRCIWRRRPACGIRWSIRTPTSSRT